MSRPHRQRILLAGVALGALGCSQGNLGTFPEPKTPGATRAGVTPLIPNDPGKQKALSPRMQKLIKNAQNADPRGR